MMDYDKLIEQLNAWNEQHLSVVCGGKHFACDYLCENEDCIVVRAATALSTLRAENEKLRAELEQAKEERDAAVKDMELIAQRINDCNIKLDDGTTVSSLELGRCRVCKHEETGDCDDGGCIFEWRGQKED